jgi:nucleotide-binding universal stress UspA family protein
MFKRILLPVDMSDKHGQAIQAAADLATQSGGEITLLHVIEVIAGLSMEEEKDFYRRLEKAARNHLSRLGQRLEERHVPWCAEIRYGNRAQEVVRYALERDGDLIVMTAPRIDPGHPDVGWGSLSYKIGILSSTPVLLVK